jgi:hypothetical protein
VVFNVNQSQKCSKVTACVDRTESGKDMVLVFYIVHGKSSPAPSVPELFLSGRERFTKVLCPNVPIALSHRCMSRPNLLICLLSGVMLPNEVVM